MLVLAASSAHSCGWLVLPRVAACGASQPSSLTARPPPEILVSSRSSCCSSHLRGSDQTHALLHELRNPAGARIILEIERRSAAADAKGGERRKEGEPTHHHCWTSRRGGVDQGVHVMFTAS